MTEGSHCFDAPDGGPDPGEPTCGDPIRVDPVLEYAHDHPEAFCFSVTGGAVYRGGAIPRYDGRYFFSDFCSGWVRSFEWDGARGTLGPVLQHPVAIDAGTLNATAAVIEGGAGEVVFVDYDGELFRLVPEPGPGLAAVAARASFHAIFGYRRARLA